MGIVTVSPGLPARNVPDSDQLTLTVSGAAGAGSAVSMNDTALPSLTVEAVAVIGHLRRVVVDHWPRSRTPASRPRSRWPATTVAVTHAPLRPCPGAARRNGQRGT